MPTEEQQKGLARFKEAHRISKKRVEEEKKKAKEKKIKSTKSI